VINISDNSQVLLFAEYFVQILLFKMEDLL
jgi:hypothetical protein